ncbi:MAG: hypothetical protein WBX25_12605 [Rhodomicrobium sp.]
MRSLAKLFGYSGGIVVVIVAGQYAYMSSDSPVSGAIWAFIYGFIAIGGLFGPALATRVWRHNKAAAGFIWAVALLSLAIAISNEIGAMAGRGSEQTAQRTQIADAVSDARKSLKLAQAEREGLRFTPADAAAVEAAKIKANAAAKAKEAECTQRGPKCREKETAESQALADLSAVTSNKALTDRAAELDAQIAAFREKIEAAGPVRETNSQGKALARLFGLDETQAAKLLTWQNTAMMIVVELLIVALILAAEEIEKNERQPEPAPERLQQSVRREEQEEAAPAAMIEHEPIALPHARYTLPEPAKELRPLPAPARVIEPQGQTDAPRVHAATRKAAEAAKGTPAPRPFPAPAKPRLVASEAVPAGSVVQIVRDLIEPGAAHAKLGIVDLYKAYAATCAKTGKRPIAPAEFPAALAPICEACGITIRDDGATGIFLLKVRLKQIGKAAAAYRLDIPQQN